MKKLLPILLVPCIALGAVNHSYAYKAHATNTGISLNVANAGPVSGTVKDESGAPLPGVSVKIKGTNNGTQTNGNGQFKINANPGDVLVFTYVGYAVKEVNVGNSTTYDVSLTPSGKNLNEVVVTALGVKRSEQSLVYANQVVSGKELTEVKSDNLMNALNGKVAGIDISPTSSGVGGSVKVILRGNKSALQGNQPLYVIDGVPMTNTSNANGQPTGTYGGSPDGGDGISNLNPDDIESITTLEGASAAALYGSQAANGVILITTKKGKAGKASINLSSSYTNDVISYKPQFQNDYGETPKQNQSWGDKLSTPATADNLADFFVHGNNFTNSVSVSAGSDKAQTYFSYANTTANGVQPTNNLYRNNLTFKETAKLLNDKLTVDVNTNYIYQKVLNTPGEGLYYNTLTGLYLFPRGVDILPYKQNYGVVDPTTDLITQNWVANEDVQQNPWWILYKNPNKAVRNRMIINSSVKYEFADWLNVQARGSIDRVGDDFEQDLYAGTNPVLSVANGQFSRSSQVLTQTYGDLIANFKIPLKASPFKIDGLFGGSITDDNTVGEKIGPGGGLAVPNVFTEQNVVITSGTSNVSDIPNYHTQIQSIFGSLNLSFNDWAFLTLTDRNDWSSTLAYTSNDSYSYPSVGLSVILSKLAKLPDFISYAKIRGSYAEVATTVPPYITHPLNYPAAGGAVTFNTIEPNPELKPTNTKSYEAGTDLKFLDNKLAFSFTWYKSNSYNQYIQYTPPASTGYAIGYINAGNIQNEGFESTLSYNVLDQHDFTWTTGINFSANRNKVIEVDPSQPTQPFTITGSGANSYESVLLAGGSFDDIYSLKFNRNASGQIILNSAGAPTDDGKFHKVGNPDPKFQAGWTNTLGYNHFTLDFTIDGKFGGQVLSMTQMMMDSYGVSLASGQARDAGGVTVNAVNPAGQTVTKVDAYTWYSTVGGRTGIGENYMYSATVVRLRQAALGYSVPVANSFVKNLKLSLIGSNLIYFYKKAPYDPEITMSSSNGMAGVDVFNQPTTRRVGLQLNATF